MYKLLLIIFFLLPLGVNAIGISASPATLTMYGDTKEIITIELLVSNPSHDVAVIDIYADNLDEIISISPTSILLSSGDQKKIGITARSKDTGLFKTTISVVATPVSSYAFKASSGIKVPIEISVTDKNSNVATVLASLPGAVQSLGLIALFGIIGLLSLLFIKRKHE